MKTDPDHQSSAQQAACTVLLIEDRPSDVDVVHAALSGDRYKLVQARTLKEAQACLLERSYDAILLDLTLPDSTGLEPLPWLQGETIDAPIVILTEADDRELAAEAIERGVQDYLVKSKVNPDVIARVVHYAIGRKKAEAELRQSQEELRQAQKIESLGQIAGGVAHDFNNLLTSILGFASIALHELDEDSAPHHDVTEIVHAAERATSLTRQLLAFSRKESLCIRPLSLNDVVSDMDQMLRRTLGEDIELVTVLGEERGSVLADSNHLDQVIMNLAVNARDAMPRGGKLTIETGPPAGDHTQPDTLTRLSVSDTGVGMSPEVQAHALEPFFTTKGRHKGTGLGLAIVQRLVHELGGRLSLESEPGVGTAFHMDLPTSAQPAERTTYSAQTPLPEGSERILLVEDEDTVRRLACRILRKLGYTVLEARNGSAALALMADEAEPLDLVFTDVVMPQMGGPEMVEELAKRRNGFKVLYASGFTDGHLLGRSLEGNGSRFLRKPYTQQALAHQVRELLDGKPAA